MVFLFSEGTPPLHCLLFRLPMKSHKLALLQERAPFTRVGPQNCHRDKEQQHRHVCCFRRGAKKVVVFLRPFSLAFVGSLVAVVVDSSSTSGSRCLLHTLPLSHGSIARSEAHTRSIKALSLMLRKYTHTKHDDAAASELDVLDGAAVVSAGGG